MYCIYQLRDPQNTGASWQLQVAFTQQEYLDVKNQTPANLEIHRIMLNNVTVNIDNGSGV